MRDIIGHESEIVSRDYTHVDEDTKRTAISRRPNILGPAVVAKNRPPRRRQTVESH